MFAEPEVSTQRLTLPDSFSCEFKVKESILRKIFDKIMGRKTSTTSIILTPIGNFRPPFNLPLWVDAKNTEQLPATYDDLFWYIEPLGEYIYFLAGDFEKAGNGYLAFNSANIEARVEVTFEADTISVHRIDDWRRQERASQNPQYGTELSHMTLGEVLAQLPEEGNSDGIVNVMPLNQKYQCVSPAGMARFEFFKPISGPRELRMIFQALHQAPDQPERLMTIQVRSNSTSQNIGDLCQMFSHLIAEFNDLPYQKLEGAIRM